MAESAKNEAFTSVLSKQKRSRHAPEESTREERGKGGGKRKHIGGQFDEAVSRQMKVIAGREGTTVLNLLAEALNLLFEDRGEPPIATGGKR